MKEIDEALDRHDPKRLIS
ncbi:hypothetical protein ACEQPO_17380 [Bacillus sp. SL00103]